jgi:glycosyltransferase involved in cell wall biosynthesis
MSEYIISFIVPVYNVEKYLNKCVGSILNGGFNNSCELILVDDGSTDASGAICDRYAGDNVIVVHKPNNGAGSTRNVGIEVARGRFVTFIDSDDYIADDAVSNILEELNKDTDVDVLFMQGDKVFPDGKETPLGDEIKSEDLKGKKKKEVLEFLACRNKFAGSACTKIFRLSFLKTNNILFPEDKRCGEDLIFVLKSLYWSEKFKATDFPYYKYRQQRENSRTNTMQDKTYWDYFLFLRDSTLLLTKNGETIDCNAKSCMSFVAYEYSLQVWSYERLNIEGKQKAQKLLNEYRWVMKYAGCNRTKAISIIVDIFGYDITSRILTYGKRMADRRKSE